MHAGLLETLSRIAATRVLQVAARSVRLSGSIQDPAVEHKRDPPCGLLNLRTGKDGRSCSRARCSAATRGIDRAPGLRLRLAFPTPSGRRPGSASPNAPPAAPPQPRPSRSAARAPERPAPAPQPERPCRAPPAGGARQGRSAAPSRRPGTTRPEVSTRRHTPGDLHDPCRPDRDGRVPAEHGVPLRREVAGSLRGKEEQLVDAGDARQDHEGSSQDPEGLARGTVRPRRAGGGRGQGERGGTGTHAAAVES